jgi:hypothetical protein
MSGAYEAPASTRDGGREKGRRKNVTQTQLTTVVYLRRGFDNKGRGREKT